MPSDYFDYDYINADANKSTDDFYTYNNQGDWYDDPFNNGEEDLPFNVTEFIPED